MRAKATSAVGHPVCFRMVLKLLQLSKIRKQVARDTHQKEAKTKRSRTGLLPQSPERENHPGEKVLSPINGAKRGAPVELQTRQASFDE